MGSLELEQMLLWQHRQLKNSWANSYDLTLPAPGSWVLFKKQLPVGYTPPTIFFTVLLYSFSSLSGHVMRNM